MDRIYYQFICSDGFGTKASFDPNVSKEDLQTYALKILSKRGRATYVDIFSQGTKHIERLDKVLN